MKWTQQQLFKIMDFPHHFQTSFDFQDQITEDLDILAISIADVSGTLERIDYNKYEMTLNVKVKMTAECALTLLPTDYQLEFSFSDLYSFVDDDSDDTVVLEKNTLDVYEIVWGNILLERPIRIVRDDAYQILEVQGIHLAEESDLSANQNESPFLSKKK
jgi:uncharacterized protein